MYSVMRGWQRPLWAHCARILGTINLEKETWVPTWWEWAAPSPWPVFRCFLSQPVLS